jgi:diguanylate cyclase
MQRNLIDTDRSFFIAQRALELIRTYGASANPRSYEVWYTFVSGDKPGLNEAIKAITAERGSVSDSDLEAIHSQYLSHERIARTTEAASATMLGEIDQVMEMIDEALGSTAAYGESLEEFSNGLSGSVDRNRIRELLAAAVRATHQVTQTNRQLETRLKDTRAEMESLRETLESVRVEAVTDPVTGISNRKHFQDMLHKSVETADGHGTPLALIVIDIDHFKRFNDLYGHLTGDQVLRLVGMTMREQVKSRATLARFGGEEFGIVLPDATAEEARALAEAIRHSVLNRELIKRSTGESLGRITVSVGVASFRAGETAMSLLERADQSMYAAKRGGRNRTVADTDPSSGSDQFSEVA